MSTSDDEDLPRLSADALRALHEFYSENCERNDSCDDALIKNRIFKENWQLSQFWYDDDTIEALVEVIRSSVAPGGSVALVCCPTLYAPVRRTLAVDHAIKLFEYDTRFSIYDADYVRYDFNEPLKLDECYAREFDIVVADPPFLSEECISKVCDTIEFLTTKKIIVCTGVTMKPLIKKLLNLDMCKFEPKHENNLGNEFASYSNFNIDVILNL